MDVSRNGAHSTSYLHLSSLGLDRGRAGQCTVGIIACIPSSLPHTSILALFIKHKDYIYKVRINRRLFVRPSTSVQVKSRCSRTSNERLLLLLDSLQYLRRSSQEVPPVFLDVLSALQRWMRRRYVRVCLVLRKALTDKRITNVVVHPLLTGFCGPDGSYALTILLRLVFRNVRRPMDRCKFR